MAEHLYVLHARAAHLFQTNLPLGRSFDISVYMFRVGLGDEVAKIWAFLALMGFLGLLKFRRQSLQVYPSQKNEEGLLFTTNSKQFPEGSFSQRVSFFIVELFLLRTLF